MKRLFYTLLIIFAAVSVACGQIIECNPEFPNINSQNIKITFHADQGTAGLKNYTGDVYAHTGVILKGGSDSDWKNVVAEWDENLDKCKLTRTATNTYTLTISDIKEFYGLKDADAEKVEKLAFVFRSSDGKKEGKETGGKNIFQEIYEANKLNISILSPSQSPYFVDPNQQITISVAISEPAIITYSVDNETVKKETQEKTNSSYSISALSNGIHTITITAETADNSATATSQYIVRQNAETAEMSKDLRRGVNKISDNSATFVLFAPNKSSAYVIGDFNNWNIDNQSVMKKDGDYFFCTISGLDKDKEYAYQYIVDENIRIADPYTEKILDPDNDKYISNSVYPNLKSYPENKTTGIVSTFTLNKNQYDWSVKNFKTPSAKDLVIYELLIRDFSTEGTVKAVTQNLDYLEKLGVNAIELMPFSEFEGNDSWGYNPSYYFAADKAYGTADDYKEFIDECHKRGIAVIQDIVLNHAFGSCPFVKMYYNESTYKVTSENPWFNVESPNTLYSWGYDFNHESEETQKLVDSVMSYWISEYNIDGFRFDFTKGFTNKPASTDAQCSAYDESRITILKRIYNTIKSYKSDAYMICEHLTDNSEEKVLANHGIMLWGNLNWAFCQSGMGYGDGSSISWGNYLNRGFELPALITYAESHDEERMMYKCLQYGNTASGYSVKNLETALERMKGTATMLLATPGPKMIWQFGELGYDYSINYDITANAVNDSYRTNRKPVPEGYLDVDSRKSLYNFYSNLNKLRKTNDAMLNGTSKLEEEYNGLLKKVYRKSQNANLIFVTNFNTTNSNTTIKFAHTGTWYNICSGESLTVSSSEVNIEIKAGETIIYSDQKTDIMTATTDVIPEKIVADIKIYPNPCSEYITVSTDNKIDKITILNSNGQQVKTLQPDQNIINVSDLKCGVYLIHLKSGNLDLIKKVIKN